MHARRTFFGFALSLLFASPAVVQGQSAELLMAVDGEQVLTLGKAAAVVGIVGGSLPAQANPAAAPSELRRIGYKIPTKSANSPVSAGEFSYLVMQLLDLPGGLLYSLFPGPRYALRELVSRGLFPAGTAAGSSISGQEALRILGTLVRARK